MPRDGVQEKARELSQPERVIVVTFAYVQAVNKDY